MTSIDAIAFLFLVFFFIQFCLFLMLAWIVRRYIRVVLLNAREFRRQSKLWHARYRREACFRDIEKTKRELNQNDNQ